MAGYIALHRKIKDHWIWQDPVKFRWFVDLLLTVNHADTKVLIKNKLYECKRGQTLKSYETLAREWGVNRKLVHTFIKLLEKDGMVETKTVTVSTLITVCNYDSYNTTGGVNGNATGTASVTQRKRNRDTNNNDNNENNEKKEIRLPFSSENFAKAWDEWKQYKYEQFGFKYKSEVTQQRALDLLHKESLGQEQDAINMLHTAMAKGWQGWHPEKKDLDFYGMGQQNKPNLFNQQQQQSPANRVRTAAEVLAERERRANEQR